MEARPLVAGLVLLGSWCAARPTHGQCQEALLRAGDGSGGDLFGSALAADGSRVVIGARGDGENSSFIGSAYIFRHEGGGWIEEAKLVPSDGASDDFFGYAVAMSVDAVLIGAPSAVNNGDGAAYVLRLVGGRWTEEVQFGPAESTPGDQFGRAVALREGVALVGAPRDDTLGGDAGAVYAFHHDGRSWVQAAKLLADDGALGDAFGTSIAIGGDVMIVGASESDELGGNSGSAYVYRLVRGAWTFDAKLVPSDGAALDKFGGAVSISMPESGAPRALIGAVQGGPGSLSTGSAYVFVFDGESWVQEAELLPPAGAAGDRFGESVALSPDGDAAIIGAPYHDADGSVSGAVYFFDRSQSGWAEREKMTVPEGAPGDRLGAAVGVVGDLTITGAPGTDDDGDGSGSSLAFAGTIAADCNANGAPDGCDVLDGSSGDCNGNGAPDECDIADGTSRDADADGVPDECACAADLSGDGAVDVADLVLLLLGWGDCTPPPAPCADLDGDGAVGVQDLVKVIARWGACPRG